MRSTERMETRLQRVEMHEFFLEKINNAMKEHRYIEASWLIYSCLENRYFRTIEKIKGQCIYGEKSCKKPDNRLSITTKINCVQNLCEAKCECFSKSFPEELLKETKKWILKRNRLMHNLLQLDYYENMDNDFKRVSIEGMEILKDTYKACTEFRKNFYNSNYEFKFPKEVMEKCRCNPKENKKWQTRKVK